MVSKSSLALALASLFGPGDAFWRMPCRGVLGPPARVDPMVDFGKVSDHPHVFHGGSNFGESTKYADLMESDCTSCGVKQDKSAYWTPPLYFMFSNGSTVLVPQVGGMLAYYLLFGENIQAFPEGFQMLAGDTRQRNFTWPVPDPPKSFWSGDAASQFALSQKAVGFNCLNYNKNPPEGTLYRHFMPDKGYLDQNCPDGLRLEMMFPSCWNGKDVDTPDHRSHMAYPSLVIDGDCPSGFSTRVPSMLYETIWNTNAFNGQDGKFVIGNGDPTGFGYHADFMTGWDVNFLQKAIQQCTNPSGRVEDCPLFTLQSEQDSQKCAMPKKNVLASDDCTGPSDGICGKVPVQYGPAYASKLANGVDEQPSPTSSIATVAPSNSAQVPVLSYTPGTTQATDSYGGGITVALKSAVNGASTVDSSSPVVTPASIQSSMGGASAPVVSAASVQGSVVGASAPAVSPAPTPAPSPAVDAAKAANESPDGNVISTSTYTVAGTLYHLVIEQVEVTVTAAPTA